MSKKSTIFVTDKHDRHLFVEAQSSGIPMIIIAIDGMKVVFFGKQKTPYLYVIDVIEWHQKEIASGTASKDASQLLKCMKQILEKFQKGKVKVI